MKHPKAGTLRCSCGGNVLMLVERRSDGTTWVIPRCSLCLADTAWVPVAGPEVP